MHIPPYKLILGSKSPRRQELLKGMALDFEIRTLETEEVYPDELDPRQVPAFLAELKAAALAGTLQADEVLITSDTVVLLDGEILGKPESHAHATEMLSKQSGKMHEVITGVHLKNPAFDRTFSVTTKVFFKELTPAEIEFYIVNYKPFDKAGSYGIQEWIGYIGIAYIEGSFFNVVGLPVAELYDALQQLPPR
jgi:septum formation protein